VTHLAVEPTHRHHEARLVPTEITTEPTGDVRILCDHDAMQRLDQLEEFEIIAADPYMPARLADGSARCARCLASSRVTGTAGECLACDAP
jgi:hypothetical protein